MTRSFGKIEIVVVSAGALVATLLLASPGAGIELTLLSPAVVAAMVFWIAWRDVKDFIIPDGPVLVIALLGAAERAGAAHAGAEPHIWLAIALDALLCGGALYAVREYFFRRRGVDGLGFGDVKLAAACGVLVGTTGFFWALFAASAAGLAVAAFARARWRADAADKLPFGALLAPACFLVWLAIR